MQQRNRISELRSLTGAVTRTLGCMLLASGLGMAAGAEGATFDCVIDPALVVKLGSPVTGLLESVKVDRGKTVERDQIVAEIESAVEAATVELNKARAKSTAEIEAQQARLDLSLKQLARTTKLYKKKNVSEQQVDERQAEVEINTRELARTKLARRLAELELERSQKALARRRIRSPIDGVVTERILSAGEFVHQESQIMVIAQLNPLHVETFLPAALHGQISEGLVAMVRPEQPTDGQYPAKVSVVDQVFDAASGTFGVRLILENRDHQLPAGQRCSVTFDSALNDP